MIKTQGTFYLYRPITDVDEMNSGQFQKYKTENYRAAGIFLDALKKKVPVVVVHHNDADGLCAAASLSRALDILSVDYKLFPIEKIHELFLEKIHAAHRGCVLYADLGGQSSALIGKYSKHNRLVIILDHHLPDGEVPGNVIHLNPEFFGISGDIEISGASVSSVFVMELLRQLPAAGSNADAEMAFFGVIGAFGDRQLKDGTLTGVNRIFLDRTEELGLIQRSKESYVLPGFGNRKIEEIVEILDLLGSIGFYSGDTQAGIDFLMGKNPDKAIARASELYQMKKGKFDLELKRAAESGLCKSPHFNWIDIKGRFSPMGVKAIGLFLERLIEEKIAEPDKYLIGFQHFPNSVPGIGKLDISLSKVSARVPPGLRKEIEEKNFPDFMKLIPEATGLTGGIADGCHRFSAASLIKRGHEKAFIDALNSLLA